MSDNENGSDGVIVKEPTGKKRKAKDKGRHFIVILSTRYFTAPYLDKQELVKKKAKKGAESLFEEDDDLEEDASEPPPRAARKKTITEKKQAELIDQIEAKQRKLAAEQKALEKAKKAAAAAAAKQKRDDYDDSESDSELESEEDTELGLSRLSGAITTLNPTAEKSKSDPKDRGPVRRVGAAAAGKASSQAVISPNTFKNVVQDWEEVLDDASGVMSTPSAKPSQPKNNAPATSTAQSPAAPMSTPSTSNSNSQSNSSDEPAMDSDQGKLIPELRADAKVGPKGAKASDFEGIVRAMIIRACAEFEARCCTRDAFPPLSERIVWAREAWESANRLAKVDYAFVDAVSKLIRSRGPRIRGDFITEIRPLVSRRFRFKKGTTSKVIAYNRDLYTKLKTDRAFQCKDPEAGTGQLQGRIITECLEEGFFANESSLGVVFKALFNPIPLETYALILTAIDFCLEEWSSGTQVRAKFSEDVVMGSLKVYREFVEVWNETNPEVVLKLRKRAFRRACEKIGVSASANRPALMLTNEAKERMRKELEKRTSDTDTESEGYGDSEKENDPALV